MTDLRARLQRVRLLALDFDGVFTDNSVYVSDDGSEMVLCNRSDGIGLRRVESVGITPIIISTEINPVVVHRAAKLKVECRNGCEDKLAVLTELLARQQVTLEETAFVGNDVNDEACLRAVGVPITVADAHPDVAELGIYRTRAAGGKGAVREVCDLLATAAFTVPS